MKHNCSLPLCNRDLGTANQKVIPPHSISGLGFNNRQYPLTPWYLSNHNQYMTATGHHHPWPFQLVYTVNQLTGSILLPFCHIPIDSTELIWLWFSTFIFWYQDNTVIVCIFIIESHMQNGKIAPYFSQSVNKITDISKSAKKNYNFSTYVF